MNRLFYPRLAASNLRKNSKSYFPYILSGICTVMTFYSVFSLDQNPGINQMPGGESLKIFFTLGTYIIGIFAAILLFYTNSFLIKQRKRELGLYSILGMEKKHIAKVLFYEIFYTAAASIILGVLFGMLIEKLLYMILANMLGIDSPITFSIAPQVILVTAVLFLAIFFLTLLFNLVQIKLNNPIDLLRGSEHGEREPKAKWVFAVIGVLCLGLGYGIAIVVESPIDALLLFFVAVLAVIIGTYCLFTAGSIAILKILKKNKRFYYSPNNFISVSSMLYRMKRNAVGLANICILSTMVLVTVSTTVSLYMGQADMHRTLYPFDFTVSFDDRSQDGEGYVPTEEKRAAFDSILRDMQNKHGFETEDRLEYKYMNTQFRHEGDVFSATDDLNGAQNDILSDITFLTLEDYNRFQKTSVTLDEDEILIFSTNGTYGRDTAQFGELTLKVRELDEIALTPKGGYLFYEQHYIIAKDFDAVKNILKAEGWTLANDDLQFHLGNYIGFNFAGDDQEHIEAATELQKRTHDEFGYEVSTVSGLLLRYEWMGVFGGFLFLGIFLGVLFMMAAILIIYYKQITEGYDDRERFDIMQKVGLSKKEVKQTIQKQVMLVFFLPLVVAIIHVAFAFNVIRRILLIFGLANVWLFGVCTVISVVFFAIVYFIVYQLTAKAYYKIVEQK